LLQKGERYEVEKYKIRSISSVPEFFLKELGGIAGGQVLASGPGAGVP
jgi:hypothetical protein